MSCRWLGPNDAADARVLGDHSWLAAATTESEEAVVAAVRSGKMLKSDGLYYFVANGSTAALRRKCDHSLVARIALAPESVQGTRKTAIAGG